MKTLDSIVRESYFTPQDRITLNFFPSADEGQRYQTAIEHSFDNKQIRVTVPARTPTDLASIPWFARWLLPLNGRYQRAALFHDQLCYQAKTADDRFFGDAVFYLLCKHDGCSELQAQVLFRAVRIGSLWWQLKKGISR